jgi:hypothetical protein
MAWESIDNGLCSLSTTLMASNAIGYDEKVSKGGGGPGNTVLVFGAFLADITLHAD